MRFFITLRNALLALPKWAASFVDPTQPQTQSNLLAMLASTAILCWACARLALALARQIEKGWHCALPDVLLLASASLPLAALAGAVYSLKPDGEMQVGRPQGHIIFTKEKDPPPKD